MNEEEQRIAIAEWMGWKINSLDSGEALRNPKGEIVNAWYNEIWRLPDYINDLNAIHEAEKKLSREQCHIFNDFLMELKRPRSEIESEPEKWSWHSSASQRSEALCRTLWPEK